MAEALSHDNRADWLASRKLYVGASEAPIVLGVSPYSSPYKLWAEKTGLIEPDAQSAAMTRGKRLEPVVADMLAEDRGWTLENPGEFTIQRHASLPWMGCTLDRVLVDPARGRGDLQIKTASAFAAHDWDNGPPLHVQVQCQHELEVTGLTWGVVAVLIGGDELRTFEFERHDKIIGVIIEREAAFVEMVRRGIAPAIDGADATAEALKRLYPRDSIEAVDLPAESAEWDARLRSVKAELARLETEKTELENQIKAAMGDAGIGVLPGGGRYSWRARETQHAAREARTGFSRPLVRLKK